MRFFRSLLLCAAFLASACLAGTGRVDLTFGSMGKAVVDFASVASGNSSYDYPYVIALQPDGKILIGGSANNGSYQGNRAAIARLHSDGALDTSFGTNGRVTMAFGTCAGDCMTSSLVKSIAVLPDGKILVGGGFEPYGSSRRAVLVVARLHANGALDTTFGNAGLASVSNSPTSFDLGEIALQPDGRILLVARTQEPLPGEPPLTLPRLVLFRIDAQGALDPSFGTGGKVSPVLGEGSNYPGGRGTKVHADGRITVVAQVGSFPDLNVAIATFSSTGVLQANTVIDVASQGKTDFLQAVAFQPDGKILFSTSGAAQNAVVRVMADGARDPTFGSNGVIYGSLVHALHVLPDGKILALTIDPHLRRYLPDGKPDTSLGISGTMPIGGGSAWVSALQPDGRFLVATEAFGDAVYNSDMSLTRFDPDGPAPLEASISAMDFGGQSIGMRSPPISFTLTNKTTIAFSIPPAIGASVPFPSTDDCGVLAAGGTCTMQVSFRPYFEGVYSYFFYVGTPAGVIAIPVSGVGEKSLVTHFYRTILRRAADLDGKAYWTAEAARLTAAGVNPNEAWFAMSGTFYASPEYIAFARDDSGFVTDLYRTFFDRDPDNAGIGYWTGLLAAGLPRSAILTSFMLSFEFSTLTQRAFGYLSVRAEMDMLMDLYRGILGRTPDEAGLGYWVYHLRTAQCAGAEVVRDRVDTISRLFLESAEYSARGHGNAEYVVDLYNAFLRRGPDASGMVYWAGQLNAGISRETLRQQFVASPEFSGRVAAVVKQGCLAP